MYKNSHTVALNCCFQNLCVFLFMLMNSGSLFFCSLCLERCTVSAPYSLKRPCCVLFSHFSCYLYCLGGSMLKPASSFSSIFVFFPLSLGDLKTGSETCDTLQKLCVIILQLLRPSHCAQLKAALGKFM